MSNNRQDFNVSGRLALGPGEYGNLHFSGSGRLTGDITCTSISSSGALTSEGSIDCEEQIKCSGAFHCKGSVRTKALGCSGSTHIDGGLETGKLECSGSVKIDGSCSGESIETSGSLAVKGSLEGKSLDVSGSVKVGKSVKMEIIDTQGSVSIGGDCEAERFISAGRLDISGLLNAGEIKIRLSKADSRIADIGGERIEVRRAARSGIFDFNPYRGTLDAGSIEGDDIYLENTKARNVRGTRVYIGSRCEIDTVEYTGSFEKDADAVVKNLVKVGSGADIQ